MRVKEMNIKQLRAFAKEQYEISGNGRPWLGKKQELAYNKFTQAKNLIKEFEANHTIEEEVEIYRTLRK